MYPNEDVISVEKKNYKHPNFRTTRGVQLDVEIGYECYGTLSKKKDNAIFFCPSILGFSHAAGKYLAPDNRIGLWGAIVGPNKLIDTNRYFVVSADTLCNFNFYDSKVTTVGPGSINPATGKPWGMSFPIIMHADQVNLHKALLDSLGIKKLQLVAGISMGGALTMQWGAQYPNYVARLLPICGRGLETSANLICLYQVCSEIIRNDVHWNQGNYYESNQKPINGLRLAIRQLTVLASSSAREWSVVKGGRQWSCPDSDPAHSFDFNYAVNAWLDLYEGRLKYADPNALLYLMRSEMLYSLNEYGHSIANIKSPTLFICENSDLFANSLAEIIKATVQLRTHGIPAATFDLESGMGHIAGVTEIKRAEDIIDRFMSSKNVSTLPEFKSVF